MDRMTPVILIASNRPDAAVKNIKKLPPRWGRIIFLVSDYDYTAFIEAVKSLPHATDYDISVVPHDFPNDHGVPFGSL